MLSFPFRFMAERISSNFAEAISVRISLYTLIPKRLWARFSLIKCWSEQNENKNREETEVETACSQSVLLMHISLMADEFLYAVNADTEW